MKQQLKQKSIAVTQSAGDDLPFSLHCDGGPFNTGLSNIYM